MKLVYPDYTKSIPSVIASIEQYYGIRRGSEPLDCLKPYMSRKYKNIVLLIFDGMGSRVLENTLDGSEFLLSRRISDITTVYPPTTVAAMTSWYSGASPNEHGWLGWSLFFKELCRCIDIFPKTDSFTREPCMPLDYHKMIMPYESLMERIYNKNKEIRLHSVFSKGCLPFENYSRFTSADNIDDFCRTIRQQCMISGEKFIFGYWTQPDEILHSMGCTDNISAGCIRDISVHMERLSRDLDDTLLIISADHGMIDIDEEIYINTLPEINECLVMPPSMEARAMAFFVKNNMCREFESRFRKRFGSDFLLMTRAEVLKKGLLGGGVTHAKTSDFLGDYLAVAVGRKILRYNTMNGRMNRRMYAHHAGLTEDEMLIPLIAFSKK